MPSGARRWRARGDDGIFDWQCAAVEARLAARDGDLEAAGRAFRNAYETHARLYGDHHVGSTFLLFYYGKNLLDRGLWGESEAVYRRLHEHVVDSDGLWYTMVRWTKQNLAWCLRKQANDLDDDDPRRVEMNDEALLLLREAHDLCLRRFGTDHRESIEITRRLAKFLGECSGLERSDMTLDCASRVAEARQLFEATLDAAKRKFGEEHESSQRVSDQLASLLGRIEG